MRFRGLISGVEISLTHVIEAQRVGLTVYKYIGILFDIERVMNKFLNKIILFLNLKMMN